jgi:hypothetical protein
MKTVLVKESHFASDLAVLKSKLESEGIECWLEGELVAQILPHIQSSTVKLLIKEVDTERVCQILKESGEPCNK